MAVVGIGEGRASVKERGGGDLQRSNGGKGKLKRRESGELRWGESGGVGRVSSEHPMVKVNVSFWAEAVRWAEIWPI